MMASFGAALRASLAGLQSTMPALPFADNKTKVLISLLSIPTLPWAVANKDKLSNERQLSEISMCLQLGQIGLIKVGYARMQGELSKSYK